MKHRGYVEELDKVPATELIELIALIRAVEADAKLSQDQRSELSEWITEKELDEILERREAKDKLKGKQPT